MMKFASEKAMALVDGQLAPAEAPAVIQEIARSPALMRQVQQYLAVNPRQIGDLFEDVDLGPVPDDVMDTVLHSPMGEVRQSKPGFVEKLAALAARTKERYTVPGWSLAAGPAVAGAAVAIWAYALMPTSSIGAYADAGMVVPPLESTMSDSKAQLVFKPVLSYRSKSNELCRQFEVQYDAKHSSHAVACRRATGNWRMVMATKPGPFDPEKSAPAETEARRAVDRYVDANISGKVLELEDERKALSAPVGTHR